MSSTDAATGPKLLTVREAATRLGMHPRSVRRLIAQRSLPAVKLGQGLNSPIRVPADELEAWIYGEEVRHREN